MRILLRHNRSGHYYNGGLTWVAGRDDASDLGGIDGGFVFRGADEANAEVFKLRTGLEPVDYCPRVDAGIGEVKDKDVWQRVEAPGRERGLAAQV
jgi:hypothetical protein